MTTDNEKKTSKGSIFGLNWMIFCMSDVRPGIGPFLAIYLKSYLHWSSDLVGLALGITDFTAAISQIPCGWLIDSLKIKRLFIFIASFSIALACLLILSYPTLPAILFAQSMIGISSAIIPPAIAAITLGLVGRQFFPKRVSINETWNHTGNLVAAAVVGLSGAYLGAPWILYLVIIFASGSIFFLSFINPNEINHSVARELMNGKDGKNKKPVPISTYLKKSYLLIFCLAVFLFHLGNAAQLPLIGQLLADKKESASSLFMGACIILAQAVMIGVAYSLGFLINVYGRKPIFMVGLAALPIRALLFTLSENPAILLGFQLIDGISAGIYGVISIITISDIAKGTGRFNFSLGLMALSQGLGASCSNFISGFVVKSFGYNAGFLNLAAIALFALSYYTIFMPETKNEKSLQ